ncbi:MAG TPA: 3-oxoacyl-[acyl-carrier-protein] reductase [Rhodothermales bacterium]
MQISFEGKSVLVTGGSRGIGRAIALAFAEAGARVAFTYRSAAEEAANVERELAAKAPAAIAIQSDAASAASAQEVVDRVVQEWGSLDVLVNNAGITRDNLVLRMGEEDWDAVIDTNLKGVFNFCKAAYRTFMKQRAGRIINISSVVGVAGNAGQVNYSASKAGIIGLTKSLAKELGSRSITVNAVAPGYVDTDMTTRLSDATREAILKSIPLGRTATSDEIAASVLFLASDAASYITGHVLHVDGGMAM